MKSDRYIDCKKDKTWNSTEHNIRGDKESCNGNNNWDDGDSGNDNNNYWKFAWIAKYIKSPEGMTNCTKSKIVM